MPVSNYLIKFYQNIKSFLFPCKKIPIGNICFFAAAHLPFFHKCNRISVPVIFHLHINKPLQTKPFPRLVFL